MRTPHLSHHEIAKSGATPSLYSVKLRKKERYAALLSPFHTTGIQKHVPIPTSPRERCFLPTSGGFLRAPALMPKVDAGNAPRHVGRSQCVDFRGSRPWRPVPGMIERVVRFADWLAGGKGSDRIFINADTR